MSCIDLATTSRGMSQGFGETAYRHLSSVAHAAETGLVGTLVPAAAGDTTKAFGKHSEQQAKHFIAPLQVYVSMGDRFIAYFGWDTARWSVARDNALDVWVTYASQGPRATKGEATRDQVGNAAPVE